MIEIEIHRTGRVREIERVVAHSKAFQTMHNVVSLHSDIWASCRIRNRGPSGTPNFCRRSSPKYGSSIMPTRSASNKLAYFCERIKKLIKQPIELMLFYFSILDLLHSLSVSEIVASGGDLRQKNVSIFLRALDS